MYTHLLTTLLSLLAVAVSPAYTQNPSENREGIAPVTISYTMKVTSGKKNVAAADGYDGGSKTIFLQNGKARIRMVSLMRMESIFFSGTKEGDRFATLVKESGKDTYKRNFSKAGWTKFNDKYADAACTFSNDSLEVLGFNCKKATINCKDGSEITLYYTSDLPRLPEDYEPVFACIPGMVMQYEYTYKSSGILYQAASVSRDKISPNIFKIPARITRKFQ